MVVMSSLITLEFDVSAEASLQAQFRWFDVYYSCIGYLVWQLTNGSVRQ